MPHLRFVRLVPVVAALFLSSLEAPAQEIKWRRDYSAARKEAAETGRPLLLDFGTEACFWCRKLDATTFRDPKVVKLVNEQFVPVKLDGNREQRLTAALQIDGFPTLLLATPEGKVVGRRAGYTDATQFMALAGPCRRPAPRPPGADALNPKAQIDATLAALYPEIAAALDRGPRVTETPVRER